MTVEVGDGDPLEVHDVRRPRGSVVGEHVRYVLRQLHDPSGAWGAMTFDLLLCRAADDPTFHALTHDEASVAAHSLYRGLRDGLALIEARDHLRVHVGPMTFVACARVAGQPYAPLALELADAEAIVSRLRSFLNPAGEQEVYFNTRFFERPAS